MQKDSSFYAKGTTMQSKIGISMQRLNLFMQKYPHAKMQTLMSRYNL